MRVWIENYIGCTCSYVCLFKHDLPGFCATHGNYSEGTTILGDYRGEMGYTQGVVDGVPTK